MKTQATKNPNVYAVVLCCAIILFLMFSVYSCAKKEPVSKPSPDEIMEKIAEQFPEVSHDDKLPETKINELYAKDKNKPVDLSKIEKYSIMLMQSGENSPEEIGIFKLYDKVNADYIKEIAQARITKMQDYNNKNNNAKTSEIINKAEKRSYGEYVYYVSHPLKDKIFEIIENALRGM